MRMYTIMSYIIRPIFYILYDIANRKSRVSKLSKLYRWLFSLSFVYSKAYKKHMDDLFDRGCWADEYDD